MPDEDILNAKKREVHTVFGMKNVLANPTLIQRTSECWKCVKLFYCQYLSVCSENTFSNGLPRSGCRYLILPHFQQRTSASSCRGSIAVGIVSGWASCGIYETIKNVTIKIPKAEKKEAEQTEEPKE